MTGREDEIKFRLAGPEDLRRLLAGLPGPAAVIAQENIYLDTADLGLARRLAMLRIRVAGQDARLTLKRGTEVEAGYFRSIEVEAALRAEVLAGILADPPTVWRLDLPPVREARSLIGEVPLAVIGKLRNERSAFRAEGFRVEVDRMVFPDGSEEYEVEMETAEPDRARRWLGGELARLGVRAEPGRETKFERLLRKMGN
jgi:uncharacterized protein YjbK